jgi:ParB family chromosome partitioning protein
MSISLSEIHENGHNVRRLPAGAQADTALEDSIRSQGVLVPILVRPEADGYTVIAGHRRVAAARAAGLTEIPALVMQGLVNGHATAAQAAENMVRAPMHPVDQWRAIVQLQNDGFTLTAAADALGMNHRFAKRLDKLGRLHPDVLALIERHGLPDERHLSVIAMAPADQQRKAAKARDAVAKGWNDEEPTAQWHTIAEACRSRRFSRNHAIFDVEKVKIAWDEDLFAEPDSDDQFTTTNAKAFLAAQQAALEADIEARQGRKERVRLTAYDGRGGMSLPTGFQTIAAGPGTGEGVKTKTDQTIFCAIDPSGRPAHWLCLDTKAASEREKQRAARQREKEKAERKAAKSGAAAQADAPPGEGDAGDDEADGPMATAAKLPFTKAGMAAIAAAKTEALRAHLRGEETAQRSHEDMLRLMILLLGCRNISIHSDGVNYPVRLFEDLAERLLLPGGQIDPHTGPTLPGIAAEAIARIVGFSGDGMGMRDSGPAAEWIGAAIGADEALPRFDTAEFLAHVNGDELRRAAGAAGIKPPSKVSAMREQLVDKLPNWKPAAFGAPAPIVNRDDRP